MIGMFYLYIVFGLLDYWCLCMSQNFIGSIVSAVGGILSDVLFRNVMCTATCELLPHCSLHFYAIS